MERIEQLIWSMLEDMGIDLENDNDKSEICDEYIDRIKDKIEKGCKHENEKMHQGDGFVYVTCKDCGTDL